MMSPSAADDEARADRLRTGRALRATRPRRHPAESGGSILQNGSSSEFWQPADAPGFLRDVDRDDRGSFFQ